MHRTVRGFAQIILVATVAIGYGLAQDADSEKHVTQIVAEDKARHPEGASASIFCHEAHAAHLKYPYLHLYPVNEPTLEKDLAELMRKSDDVVLAGFPIRVAWALSPSDDDAVTYADVRVLRTWKGSYKPGDVLTVASPSGYIKCGPELNDQAGTFTGRDDITGPSHKYGEDGPEVLFLRRENSRLLDGFTLTGGDGMQGMFVVRPLPGEEQHSPLEACYLGSVDRERCVKVHNGYPSCRDPQIDESNIAECNAALNVSGKPVSMQLKNDPLRPKYEGMPLSRFLKEMQSVANSASGDLQAGGAK